MLKNRSKVLIIALLSAFSLICSIDIAAALAKKHGNKTYYAVVENSSQIPDEVNILFGSPPNIKAKYASLVDYHSGIFLYEKNANVAISPSSMTKMMTVYLIFKALKEKKIHENDLFHVSEKAWRTGGTKMFVGVNTKVTVKDLLLGAIVQSGNDACVVLAEGLSGSEDAFVEEMNLQAQQLGMVNTKFYNSTGLPQDGHTSTVHDLAILGMALIRDFPEYYSLHSRTEFVFNGIKQTNRNAMLGKNGVDGVKTGYTDKGGYGITTSAISKERRLISVVNGLSSDKERIADSMALLAYGFDRSKLITIYKANQPIVNIDVMYGSELTLPLITKSDIQIIVPRVNTKENISNMSMFDVKILYYTNLIAPIVKNQKLGEVVVKIKDTEIQRTKLYAANNVDKANFIQQIIQNIERIFSTK